MGYYNFILGPTAEKKLVLKYSGLKEVLQRDRERKISVAAREYAIEILMSWKNNITVEDSQRDASRVQNCIGIVSPLGDETIQNCGQSHMNTTTESFADEDVTTKPFSSGSHPPSSLSLESDAAPLQSGKRKGVFGMPEDEEFLEKNTSDDSLSASLYRSMSSIPLKKKRKRRNAIPLL